LFKEKPFKNVQGFVNRKLAIGILKELFIVTVFHQ